jgi:hypothetical protein
MKLTAYIKHQNSFFPIYWIKRNNNNITGAFDGGLFQSMLYPSVNDIDIHFTYPKDGRLHYSIKSGGEDIEERFFVNSEKNSLNKEGNTLLNGKPFNIFEHMLPVRNTNMQPLKDFSKSSKLFQFPMSAISYINGTLHFSSSKRKTTIKETPKTIVVDTKKYKDITINPSAVLIGKNYDLNSFLEKTTISVVDDSTYPIMVLFVSISEK